MRVLRSVSAITLLVLFAGLPFVLLNGIGDGDDITERPPRQATPFAAEPLESRIVVSANVDLHDIQAALNDSTPNSVAFSGRKSGCYRDRILGVRVSVGCNWSGEIAKRGNATISGSGRQLLVAAPLRARVTVRTNRFGIQETAHAELTATASAAPRLAPDWSLEVNLTTDFRWDRRPEMRILFDLIPISLGSVAEPLVRAELAKLEQQIDAEVENLNMRAGVATAWSTIHEPLRLSSDPEVWLRIGPQAVYFSGVRTENNVMHASVAVSVLAETVLGERPDALPRLPLPAVEGRPDEDGKFLVRLPILLEYDALREELGELLRLGQKWAPVPERPHHNLTVEDIEVYPSGDSVVVGVRFVADLPRKWLDARGVVYFTGRLVVDDEARIVRVEELDFTATTDNTLLNTALLLFDERIVSQLSAALTYEFQNDYAGFLASANRELNRDFGHGIASQGELEYVGLGDVVMGERGIHWSVVSEGRLQLDVRLAPKEE